MNPLFQVHVLNETGLRKAQAISEAFSQLLETLSTLCDDTETRDFSIVKTKLQEANFFAKRAMAIRPQNQRE